MDARKLIDLIELKDRSIWALMDYYCDKGVNIKELQRYIDNISDNMAKSFIEKYKHLFNNKDMQTDIFRYLDSLGVKRGHTGRRFSEALYNNLHIYLDNQQLAQIK